MIGPIPAYAGQPKITAAGFAGHGAYPRVCGATSAPIGTIAQGQGLSPRMRGNLLLLQRASGHHGPIPAYAGQPPTSRRPRTSGGAYPRVCGATGVPSGPTGAGDGLSPRMRGNRRLVSVGKAQFGPIPAYAGQPVCRLIARAMLWAYPRVCGATASCVRMALVQLGLSPRMRGNQRHACVHCARKGPIPAYAGQPGRRAHPWPGCGAYPRVCGATRCP